MGFSLSLSLSLSLDIQVFERLISQFAYPKAFGLPFRYVGGQRPEVMLDNKPMSISGIKHLRT
jgi:hypothetical protein